MKSVAKLAALLLTFSTDALAALPVSGPEGFLQKHCTECHGAEFQKGGFDLSKLSTDLSDPNAFAAWVKVYDKVAAGDMPPKGEPRAPVVARNAFESRLFNDLVQADRPRWSAEGRSLRRRMNRYEYEDTLRDLLSLPHLVVKSFLPEDGESNRFNKVGEALDVSHVNLARYLNAAEFALRSAMAHQLERPETTRVKYYARDQRAFIGGFFQGPALRQAFPLLGWQGQPELIVRKGTFTVGPDNPTVREQEAVAMTSSTYEPTEIAFSSFRAPTSGFYKLRFSTYSIWVANKPGSKPFGPDQQNVLRGRRSEPVTIYSDAPPHDLRRLGGFDAEPQPGLDELTAWLNQGETIRPDASRLVRPRPNDWKNPLAEKDGMPGVAFRWMEAEGPLLEQWPPLSHQRLFGDLPLATAAGTTKGIEVIPRDANLDARRLLTEFLARAYRKPATEADFNRFFAVFEKARASGYSFTQAMLASYTSVLSSPGFLYVDVAPGRLDDLALASRLSFFLINAAPDDELRALAQAGRLSNAKVLRAQTERLLNDPRSRRFVNDFLDYWLDLRRMAASAPDASLYPDYQLDDFLVESMMEESQLFFIEMLKRDLGVSHLVASNFAMLNERLASHYGIANVTGFTVRRVPLAANSLRGGFLTQASVLKVTANGTTTSPVVRGAWIMERLLGKRPPPPPASVPAVEPDTTGATTIRQQLEKHRSNGSCNSCHKYMDPAGFALEAFDPMGGWRDKYRAIGGTTGAPKVQGVGHDGLIFAFSWGLPPDATGELADGRTFKDVRELRRLLLTDTDQLARNMVNQLVTYATGAPVSFADRVEVNAILAKTRDKRFGLRTLVHALIQNDLFRKK